MRILVLDANVTYLSPARNNMPIFLSLLGDVVFFGPGYVSEKILKNGLDSFIEQHKSFDVVICTEWFSKFFIKNDPDYKNHLDHFKKSFYSEFNSEDLISFWNQTDVFLKMDIYKILIMINYDYQTLAESRAQYIASQFDMICGLNGQLWKSIDKLKDLHLEGFNANDNWSNLISNHPQKVFPLVNFVTTNEFYFGVYEKKTVNWSVLGAEYYDRILARNGLVKSNIKVQTGRGLLISVVKALNKFGFRPYTRKFILSLLNYRFFRIMRRSKFNFTCGSKLKFPIRKYFEIPASGSLLVCTPCNGFNELGFIHGENCIISNPEGLTELNRKLMKDPEKSKEIAKLGQNMVLKNHTAEVRASQMRNAIKLGVEGKFYGAKWSKGSIVFNSAPIK
jgi:hypothetical protein